MSYLRTSTDDILLSNGPETTNYYSWSPKYNSKQWCQPAKQASAPDPSIFNLEQMDCLPVTATTYTGHIYVD